MLRARRTRGSGGTGRRARLRGVWFTPYGFKSRFPHQKKGNRKCDCLFSRLRNGQAEPYRFSGTGAFALAKAQSSAARYVQVPFPRLQPTCFLCGNGQAEPYRFSGTGAFALAKAQSSKARYVQLFFYPIKIESRTFQNTQVIYT